MSKLEIDDVVWVKPHTYIYTEMWVNDLYLHEGSVGIILYNLNFEFDTTYQHILICNPVFEGVVLSKNIIKL